MMGLLLLLQSWDCCCFQMSHQPARECRQVERRYRPPRRGRRHRYRRYRRLWCLHLLTARHRRWRQRAQSRLRHQSRPPRRLSQEGAASVEGLLLAEQCPRRPTLGLRPDLSLYFRLLPLLARRR